jgi:peptide chain release factor 3
LLDGAGASFDAAKVSAGRSTPVFCGSAVTNFGVALFLDGFIDMAPAPAARVGRNGAGREAIEPDSDRFTGFVFKIQANMDPRHRDRIAFVRVCSGRFERDMTVRNVRSGKDVRLTRAMKLFGSERDLVDEAYAGDVVGLANPGTFAIGDTLCAGPTVRYDAIPAFPPEHFALVRNVDTAAYKSFQKGIEQLREEGAIQVFFSPGRQWTEPVLAAVGELQFEVTKYRLEAEYNVKTELISLPYGLAMRVTGDPAAIAAAAWPSNARLVHDWAGKPIALFESEWSMRLAQEWNEKLKLHPFGEADGAEDTE